MYYCVSGFYIPFENFHHIEISPALGEVSQFNVFMTLKVAHYIKTCTFYDTTSQDVCEIYQSIVCLSA